MISSGNAWVYDKYVTDKTFYEDQDYAKSNNLGFWKSEDPIEPWIWRRKNK